MICIWNYYIAKQRLKEAVKTVDLMGGPDECQPMVVAQADFIQMELDFYILQMKSLVKWFILCGIIGFSVYFGYVFYKG